MSVAVKQKTSHRKSLGEILVEAGLLTQEVLEQYLIKQAGRKERLGETLVKEGVINDVDLAKALGTQFHAPFISLDSYEPVPEAVSVLTEKIIRTHQILPLAFKKGTLILALWDPLEAVKVDSLLKMKGVQYQIVVSTPKAVAHAIEKAFKTQQTIEQIVKEPADSVSIELLIDKVIERAVQDHSSDIHLEPADEVARIRVRVDGVLQLLDTYPLELHGNVISRLKVLARMDIAEKRNPQDGRFPYTADGKTVDIRISTLPTIKGEKAVMRIIDKSALKGSFSVLGIGEETEKSLNRLLSFPHGIFFITGPTGSGKTTTLYAMLNSINEMGKNIITVEDPVEYQFDMINQVQVHEKAGLSFAGLLRNILRQDPDVLMIGEVRDKETADLAFQAALTGHLVLSTLHTNDAVSTATRLVDIGVEPFLISSALLGVLSQRLVRVLCPHCKEETTVKEEESLLLGRQHLPPGAPIYIKKGCEKCYQTGYRGRISLYELLIPDSFIQKAIVEQKQESEILNYATSKGFKTMRQDGIAKILAGITSVEEVIKATL